MNYRLCLDLGSTSIATGVIELDKNLNPKDIVDAGVRIFGASEGAEERRLKRTARKNLARTRKRLELLAQKLFENKLWVNNLPQGTPRLQTKSPYKIRYDAVHGKLDNPNYIGRALMHIAKHRGAGFISASEELQEDVLEEEKISKKKISAYEMMAKHLQDTGSRTIGEFFYKRIIDKPNPQNRHIRQSVYALKSNIVDYAIPRYLVKDEFHQIWDRQAQYFTQMQAPNLKQEVYDILFYERPPTPYATGKCLYFRDENRLLKAHPLTEMRRIYEEVNNILIINDMGKRKLSLEERDKIICELLLQGINAGKKSIKKLLNLSGQQKISLIDDKVIKAYLYARPEFADIEYIKNLSETDLCNFINFLAEPINPDDKSGRLYNEDTLIQKLKPILKIDSEKEIGSLLSKLPKGRGMLGLTATKALLEKLKKEVISHREATDLLSKTDARFIAEEEIARQTQGKCFELPYYGKILQTDTQPLPPLVLANNPDINEEEKEWGKIPNPSVHMALNQLRKVVNEIIKIYGRPYDINIEVAREIGLSKSKKKELEKIQRANEKLNDEAKNYLKEHKLFINRQNILKFKLAKEQGWRDAYDPSIKISHNFKGMEIDHMCPRDQQGSNTYNNLCLVDRNSNLGKGDKFPYEWFEIKYKDKPEVIREILNNARTRMPNKAWRFEPDARERFEEQGDVEETSRYLTDTSYIAKMACRYLRAIVQCDNQEDVINTRILAVRGSQTEQLRRNWNLQGIEYDLMGLDIPRYISCQPYWLEQETGVIVEGAEKPDIDGKWKFYDKTKNKEWLAKPRIDHRHHALDALTVGCVSRSLLQRLASASAVNHASFPLPLTSIKSVGEFREKVLETLKRINVSHKPEHSPNGELHEATSRTVLCQNPNNPNNYMTVYSRKILDVVKSFKDINKLIIPDSIKDDWYPDISLNRKKQAKLVHDFELCLKTAEQVLIMENQTGFAEGAKEIKITEARIIARAFSILQEMGLWKGEKFKCYQNLNSLIQIPKHGVSYLGGNNHRIDFFQKDGKVNWEVINRFSINQPNFVPKWKKDGGKIIWSIQQGDLLELNTPEEWETYTDKNRCIAKVKKFSKGSISIDYSTDARMTSPKEKNIKYMFVNTLDNRGLKYLLQNQARKIELTPFGKIKRKHKVLWNGKKKAA